MKSGSGCGKATAQDQDLECTDTTDTCMLTNGSAICDTSTIGSNCICRTRILKSLGAFFFMNPWPHFGWRGYGGGWWLHLVWHYTRSELGLMCGCASFQIATSRHEKYKVPRQQNSYKKSLRRLSATYQPSKKNMRFRSRAKSDGYFSKRGSWVSPYRAAL